MAITNTLISTQNAPTGAMPTPGMRKFQKSGLSVSKERPCRWNHCQRFTPIESRSQRQSISAPGNGRSAAMATTSPA